MAESAAPPPAPAWSQVNRRPSGARVVPGVDHPGPTDAGGAGAQAAGDVVVRALQVDDLDAIVRIDAAAVGRARHEYYRDEIAAAIRGSRLRTSLVAEVDHLPSGFLIASVHYGEFGRPEPEAVIRAVGVHPRNRRGGVGLALMHQFLMNASALGVERIRTEVAWDDFDLLAFFRRLGFAPARRLVIERVL
jgi:ribosomal protein S18 acetylase RimI-like enzyme